MDCDLGHADAVLLAGADADGAAVLDIEHRVGGDAVLYGPAEDHIVNLPLAWRAVAGEGLTLPGGGGGFEVGDRADGVDRRLLGDDAAVNQALEVHIAEFFKLGQAVDAADLDDPQVLAFLEDLKTALFKGGGADHLQIVLRQQGGGVVVAGAAHDHGPAEGGDTVAAVGAVKGVGQGVAVGRAAGVVVLEDDGCRTIHEILEDIEAVVDVGEVDLAGMLAHLAHILDLDPGDQTVAGLDKGAFAQSQIAVDQLIEGGLLIRVLAIAHAPLVNGTVLLFDSPGPLAIDQPLVAKRDGHVHGEVIAENG